MAGLVLFGVGVFSSIVFPFLVGFDPIVSAITATATIGMGVTYVLATLGHRKSSARVLLLVLITAVWLFTVRFIDSPIHAVYLLAHLLPIILAFALDRRLLGWATAAAITLYTIYHGFAFAHTLSDILTILVILLAIVSIAGLAPTLRTSERSRAARAEDWLQFQAHLLGNIDEAVIANDKNGTITYWNQAAEVLFGWTQKEMIGQPFATFFGVEQTREPSVDDAAGSDHRARRKDGSRLIVRMVTSPLLGDSGQSEGSITICEDITAEHEIHGRFRALVENAPDGILRTTPEGKLEYANPTAVTVLGYDSAQQLLAEVGLVTDLYMDPADRQELLRQVRSEQPLPVKAWWRRRDGSQFFVEIRARLHTDPDGNEYLEGIFHDLTDRLQAQQGEKSRMENEHLKELDRTLRDFINAAAHDLNQPLTPMKLAMYGLKQSLQGASAITLKQLDMISRNLNRMELLVQDLLDVSRLEAGTLKLDLRPVRLMDFLKETKEFFQTAATEKSIHLNATCETDISVTADHRRIIQVLFNLVGNAVKFTPKDGTITTTAQQTSAGALIEVADTGLGLSKEQIDRLFQPFSQVHFDTPNAPKGTGLGLYISKGIVEQHQGEIGVKSKGAGKGSTFWFTLPVAGTEAAERLAEALQTAKDPDDDGMGGPGRATDAGGGDPDGGDRDTEGIARNRQGILMSRRGKADSEE